jgi:hypothetical protein
MAKTPRLDEVFLVHPSKPINVGSAYSVKEAGFPNKKNLGPRPYAGVAPGGRGSKMHEAGMKPELEAVVKKYVTRMIDDFGLAGAKEETDTIRKCLEDFAHELEGAEGEDPKELDRGGPPAGSTGGK